MSNERELLQAMIDNVPDFIFQKDLKGRFVIANRALANAAGASDPKEMIGRTDRDFFPVEIADKFMSDDRVVIETARSVDNIEEPVISSSGSRKWVLTTKVPLLDSAGRVTGLIGIGRDITIRKALETQNQLLATLVQNAEDAIISFDLDRRITVWNPGAERLYGYTAKDMLGAQTSVLIPPDLQMQAQVVRERVMRDEHFARHETTRLRKDGTRIFVSITLSPLRNAEGTLTGFVSTAHDITLRKQAERALAQKAALLSRAEAVSHMGSWRMDLHTGKVAWSEEMFEIFAVDRTDFSGSLNDVVSSTVHPDDRAKVDEINSAALRDGISMPAEYRIVHPDGSLHWVHAQGEQERDETGRVAALVGFVQDITRHKQEEKALQESEERFRKLFKDHSAVNLVIDPDSGNILDANEAAAEFYGWSIDQLARMRVQQINVLPPDARKSEREAAAPSDDIKFESRHRLADGSVRDVEVFSSVIEIGGKAVLYSIIHDITVRKRAEEQLMLLKHSIDASPDPAYWFNAEGQFIYVNDAACQAVGYSREELLRMKVGDVNPRATAERWSEVWEAVKTKGTVTTESVHRRRDGTVFPVKANSTYLRLGEIEYCTGYAFDISDRKRREEEHERLQAQLVQAQKMESVGRLAGGVAHDFNNMLEVILGHAEMALEQADPALALHSSLIEIRKAAERSTELTRQLLSFARKQTVAPKALDLNETLARMLKMLQRLIGEDILLDWNLRDGLWPVMLDPSQIDQILANLCVNARDAIAGVGQITIATDNTVFDQQYCADHPGSSLGEYVLLSVRDNGRGMDEETLSHIFEPFYTTKGVGKGTGLGLATVYGIVKQNNGFISVDSEPGQGTEFSIYLPRHVGKAGSGTTQPASEPAPRGHETILVVEDEPASLKLIRMMLERQGYSVLAAGTPGDAFRLAEENAGEIHLLITDVVMPQMNGWELARQLLSLYPDIKSLFMSGYTAEIIAHNGVLDEGVRFIQKPFSTRALADKVRQILQS